MPKLTAARAEAQRRRILDAALQCFAEKGMHQTTMSDIFAASGLSAGAVYGYFASKSEIVATVAAERHVFERALLAELNEATDPLGRFLDGYLGQFRSDTVRRATVQYWAESLSDEQLAAAAREGLAGLAKARTLVARAQRKGLVRDDVDPGVTTRLLLALVQGLVLQSCWDDALALDGYRHAIQTLFAPHKSRPRRTRR